MRLMIVLRLAHGGEAPSGVTLPSALEVDSPAHKANVEAVASRPPVKSDVAYPSPLPQRVDALRAAEWFVDGYQPHDVFRHALRVVVERCEQRIRRIADYPVHLLAPAEEVAAFPDFAPVTARHCPQERAITFARFEHLASRLEVVHHVGGDFVRRHPDVVHVHRDFDRRRTRRWSE